MDIRMSKSMLQLYISKKIFLILWIFICTFNIYAFQFGNGNNESTEKFIYICDNVKDVYASKYTTYVIKNDNSLWGTGMYVFQQFGMKGPNMIETYQKIMDDVEYFDGVYLKKTDKTVWKVDNGLFRVNDNIVKGNTSFYLTKSNELFAEGETFHGVFGSGKKHYVLNKEKKVFEEVLDFYSDNLISCIITTNNELFITGDHYLPAPYKVNYQFTKVADDVLYANSSFFITKGKEVFAYNWAGEGVSGLGKQESLGILPTYVMSDVSIIESSSDVSLFLKTNGDLYGCGGDSINYQGELGFGNKLPVYVPKLIMSDVNKISIGLCYIAILKKNGELWMCGANNFVGLY